ncbi:MAG: alpha/beta hydrolase [Trebonia sp.]
MPVDPLLQVMLDEAAARAAAAGLADIAPGQLPTAMLRAGYRAAILAALGPDYVPAPLAEVRDTRAAGVPVRIYRPEAGRRPLPAVAFAHAGGWVLGDLETHDEVCRYLSAALPAVVVAVDYRLAPEHVYPAAIEDYWAVVCWLAGHADELGGDPERLIVAGDSAGGNMALAAALRARDAGGPRISAQAAAYPATDMTLGYGSGPGRSYEKYAEGYGLTAATMSWFADTYLPEPADRAAPAVSPLLAADLSGLPPAVIATAEYDPLCSEGARYAERLRAAGVPVTYLDGRGLVHGFLYYPKVAQACATAREAFADAIRSTVTQGTRVTQGTEGTQGAQGAQKGTQHVG